MNILTLLGATAAVAQKVRQDWNAYERNPQAAAVAFPLGVFQALAPDEVLTSDLNKMTIAAKQWGLWFVLWPQQSDLDWFLSRYPQIRVVRAWKPDMEQVGVTKVMQQDASGNITGFVRQGLPKYRDVTKAQLLRAFKDIVRMDASGKALPAIKRTIANIHEEVTVFAGWLVPDYTQ